ncbi:Unconventional myosin-IXb [Desmophyllum pertusum]|uniref:Unconventional myosin-IXb n=1 Tax=Desmophyllum pertusum TaxID=174260 RepID=A0A9X0D4T4_9CNID|nr:Unconventional myosin-IXb [Desmophyllum pertusum]
MDFIRTAELTEEKLRLQALYSLVQKLPRASRNTLERLVFHLARISQHQEENLMNANALSIIWAQCIMATPPGMSALECMQDVGKQTKCLETLIIGQLSKIRSTINNIRVIDSASVSAHKSLSMLNLNDEDDGLVENDLEGETEEEKRLLTEQLFELREAESLS